MDKLLAGTRLARTLINKYVPHYDLIVNHHKSTFGYCDYLNQVIAISSHLLLNYDIKQVRDIVLHEIAHALTPEDGGHGAKWKAMCIKIGAKPERLADVEIRGHKYEVTCPNKCFVDYYFRKPSKFEEYCCNSCDSDLILITV